MDLINKSRCDWCSKDPIYIKYHDKEWGIPVYDDKKLFEILLLETFQSGLSWITILKKREKFRRAFSNFDYNQIANFSKSKIEKLKSNAGIIRNELKIKAAKKNAICFLQVRKEFGTFNKYIWGFVDGKPIKNNFKSNIKLPINSILSDKISTDLKRRGFKFVGSTTIYAYIQAIGIINNHTMNCFKY